VYRGVDDLGEIIVAEHATVGARKWLQARKESINHMDNLLEHPESRSQFSLIRIPVKDSKHPIAQCRVSICPISATIIPAYYGMSLSCIDIDTILVMAADPMEAC
jgi:hypothetical protein